MHMRTVATRIAVAVSLSVATMVAVQPAPAQALTPGLALVNIACYHNSTSNSWVGSQLATNQPQALVQHGTYKLCYTMFKADAAPDPTQDEYFLEATVTANDVGWSADDGSTTAASAKMSVSSSITAPAEDYDATGTASQKSCSAPVPLFIGVNALLLAAGVTVTPTICHSARIYLDGADEHSAVWSARDLTNIPKWDVVYAQVVGKGQQPTFHTSFTTPYYSNVYSTAYSPNHWVVTKAWHTFSIDVPYIAPPRSYFGAIAGPSNPSNAPTQPATACDTCNATGVQAGGGGILSATSVDPGAYPITYTFRVYQNSGSFPLAASGVVSNVPSGQPGRWSIPANSLTSGVDYSYVVDVQDPHVQGTSSTFAVFSYQAEKPPGQPSIACDTCNSTAVQVGDGGTLSATATDPNGDDISYQFRLIENSAGFTPVSSGWVTAPSGTPASWQIPTGSLKSGESYAYVVDVEDSQLQGTSSNFGYFTYETNVAPGVPVMACASCNRTGVQSSDAAQLTAKSTDGNGDDLNYMFRLVDNTTGFPEIADEDVFAANGSAATWHVPAGILQPGHSYAYLASAVDPQGAVGPSAAWTYFTYQSEVAPSTPAVTCSSCNASQVQIGGGTATLTASATDPNGDDLSYQFRLVDNQGTFPEIADSAWLGGYASGAKASWTIPAGLLVAGHTYAYLAQATDGQYPGGSAAWTYFSYQGAVAGGGVQLRGAPSSDITSGSHNYLKMANPSGAVVGDLLVAEVTVQNQGSVTTPTGWTLLSGWPRTDGTQTWSTKQYVFTHRMVTGDAGPYTFATNGPGGYIASSGLIVAASGVSTTKTVTSNWSQLASGTSLAVNPPASTAGSLLLGLSSDTNGFTTATTTTVSAPLTAVTNVTEPGWDSAVASAGNQPAGQSPAVTFTYSQGSQAVATIVALPAV